MRDRTMVFPCKRHACIRTQRTPRVEAEKHYYNPYHEKLCELGFEPVHPLEEELEIMFKDLERFEDRIIAKKERIMPTVYWKK